MTDATDQEQVAAHEEWARLCAEDPGPIGFLASRTMTPTEGRAKAFSPELKADTYRRAFELLGVDRLRRALSAYDPAPHPADEEWEVLAHTFVARAYDITVGDTLQSVHGFANIDLINALIWAFAHHREELRTEVLAWIAAQESAA